MQRRKVVLIATATADLERTVEFLVGIGASSRTAKAYVDRITRRCSKLGTASFVGTARDELAPGLRTVGFERSATIAFRVLSDRIEVVNAFYGGRDIDAFYGQS